jgi:hypothetical protein
MSTNAEPVAAEAKAFDVARRVVPVGIAVAAAVIGATLLPFWPLPLVVALALVAGFGTWVDPRIGLAVALAAPVFPLGNYAASAAIFYGLLALVWLALCWRDARWGLVFICGPILAGMGLIALVPLVVQPARGVVRRAARAGAAVLAAVVVAGVGGADLPLVGGPVDPLGIGPLASTAQVGLALWSSLTEVPAVLAGVVLAAIAAGTLPWARRRSPYGVAVVGTVLTAAAVLAGGARASTFVAALIWAAAAVAAAKLQRAQ